MNFTKPGVRVDFGIGDFWRNFFEFEKKEEYINFLKLSAIIHLWHQGKMAWSKWNKDFWGRGKGLFLICVQGGGKEGEAGNWDSQRASIFATSHYFCIFLYISSKDKNVFPSDRNVLFSEHQFLQPATVFYYVFLHTIEMYCFLIEIYFTVSINFCNQLYSYFVFYYVFLHKIEMYFFLIEIYFKVSINFCDQP